MDRKSLVKNLNTVFCEINKTGKKYSEVWLSDVDFGELYKTDQFILNVKAEHHIDACKQEIRDILSILDEKAHDELQFIWSVYVYNSNEEIHCIGDEILVFDKANSCP